MAPLCHAVSVLRVHRIPFSTNVERVALAAAHKDVEVSWVDHDPADRSAIAALSGQELVPVAEFSGEVVVDSMAIVERLEELVPEPSLYPADEAARAAAEVFVTWFDEVWKAPPNELADALDAGSAEPGKVAELAALLQARLDVFEHLLAGGDFLFGDAVSVADVCAFPFLRYALVHDPTDTETFHRVLSEHQVLGEDHPRLRAWIERMDALPRA
jgi:glutathione S-transferase